MTATFGSTLQALACPARLTVGRHARRGKWTGKRHSGFSLAPRSGFWPPRISAPEPVRFPSGQAGISKRPFAPRQRLSVSRPPLPDRRFRPTSSYATPVSLAGPFGFGLAALPGFPRGAGQCPQPVTCSLPALCPSPRVSLTFRTFRSLPLNARRDSSSRSLPELDLRFSPLPAGSRF
jgi:hypothetical protein